MDMTKLIHLILDSEELLIDKSLSYAKERKYVKYSKTLREAWRLSISGLSAALATMIEQNDIIPELNPDDDYSQNEAAAFGIIEAKKHRARGIPISMFLGLMKYYHQAYQDLVDECSFSPEEKKLSSRYLKRFFDCVELGFIIEWTASSEQQIIEELQESNRTITNEKNKYLTVFESIYDPIILVDSNNHIENLNHQALAVFFEGAVSGVKYYGNIDTDIEFDWLKDDLRYFVGLNTNEIVKEQTVQTISGQKTFSIKFKKMLDISEKYRGTVIIFNDITERRRIEEELKKQYHKIEVFAFTDPMTGVSNRITGLSTLEKELSLVNEKDTPLTICYLDVDGLKAVNDTYGHLEGDALINSLVSVMKASVRKIDTVSRLGGDEFLIIFPDCSEAGAKHILNQITEQLAAFDATEKTPYPHSFSYGLLEVTKDREWNANDVIKLVDAKMYEHKFLKKHQKELGL